MEEKIELTASNIRFLLTVKRMLDGGEQPKGFRLAEALQCTRPSVHKMTKYLDAKELLRYENHSVPTLTPEGARVAAQYSTYYYAIADSLPRELVDDRNGRKSGSSNAVWTDGIKRREQPDLTAPA